MVPHGYGLNASVSVTQRSPKSPSDGVVVALGGVGEAVKEAVHAFEHRARPDKAGAAKQRRANTRLRRPAGVQPLGPGAFGQIFDDAARHRGDGAERVDHLARD